MDDHTVNEEQDRYDLKTEHGYYLKSHDFVGSSTWKMGVEVIVLTEYLLCTATHTPWKFYCRFQKKEIVVQRGEVLLSISRMVRDIEHLSRKQIRTALEKLKFSKFLEDITPNCVKGANSYKHLKIGKYESYQNPQNYHRPVRGQLAANYGPVKGHDLNKESKGNKENQVEEERRVKKENAPRGSRIPENFTLTAENLEIAKRTGLNGNVEFIFAKFRSYWEGVSGSRAIKINWPATWRNWCLNETERNTKKTDEAEARLVARIRADRAFWHAQEGARPEDTLDALLCRGLSHEAIRRYFQ